MILSNPVLYSKIMIAKDDNIKELKDSSKLKFRKTSQGTPGRETNYQGNFTPRFQVNTPRFQVNEISKLSNEEKKNIFFLQYR